MPRTPSTLARSPSCATSTTPRPESAIDQNSPGVPDKIERGDQFGRTLDTIRVGGTTRLAIGTPSEDIGKMKDAGSVQLFSSNGATLKAGARLTQNTKGVADSAERGDGFGLRLAWVAPGLGDVVDPAGRGRAEGESRSQADAGMVQVFRIGALGKEETYTQAKPGIAGDPQAGDGFGLSLAAVEGQPNASCWSACPTTRRHPRHGQRHPLQRRHATGLAPRDR